MSRRDANWQDVLPRVVRDGSRRARKTVAASLRVVTMSGAKDAKPRGKTCHWTPELDEKLKTAWASGGLRAARRAIRLQQPLWSRYSINRRAATLGLTGPRASRWTTTDINKLLLSIEGNASLSLVAKRLRRRQQSEGIFGTLAIRQKALEDTRLRRSRRCCPSHREGSSSGVIRCSC
jgi:hypothetical protein